MCSRPNSHALMANPSSGSTIQATPTPMSRAATWFGMRMPMPSPMSAHNPSTSRLSARVRTMVPDGKASWSRRLSTIEPTITDPTRLITP